MDFVPVRPGDPISHQVAFNVPNNRRTKGQIGGKSNDVESVNVIESFWQFPDSQRNSFPSVQILF